MHGDTHLAFLLIFLDRILIRVTGQTGINRHVTWPVTLMAILAAVLLSAGVLRHYWDIYTHRTVRGISFIFVGIDAAGDLFSLISVCVFPNYYTRDHLRLLG